MKRSREKRSRTRGFDAFDCTAPNRLSECARVERSTRRLWRYRWLRHLPGSAGRKYEEKYFGRGSEVLFQRAVEACRGMTCIDLGANVGDYTKIMAKHARRVIAFEPDPWTVERLRENTAGLDNVTIEAAAAGTEDGETELFRHAEYDDDPGFRSLSSSIVAAKDNLATEAACKVRVVDFPRFLRDLDERVGVLKIDVEGAEVEILEALFDDRELLRKVRYVFAETHEKKIAGHPERVEALRRRARRTWSPVVNLYWH